MQKIEHYTTTLEKIFQLTPTVQTFRLRFPGGTGFAFDAGQFCMVEVPDGNKIRKKAYSICSPPHESEYLDLCIKLVEGGLATNWFWSLKEGDQVNLAGPYGNFILPETIQDDLIFIATGTGLSPFRSMLHQLYRTESGFNRLIWLIFGVRYEDQILYNDEWRQLAQEQSKFNYIPTISRPKKWDGEVGYVQDKLAKYIESPQQKQLYVCGLIPMIEGVEKTAIKMGFDLKQIHFEKYV
jgi:ferredoxin-NADP reductase